MAPHWFCSGIRRSETRGAIRWKNTVLSLSFCLLTFPLLTVSVPEAADSVESGGGGVPLVGDLSSYPTKAPKCDQTFVSRESGPRNGTFHAPELLNEEGHSRQCIYTFVARQRERVQITFTSFVLRGTPPECNHEYLDVYSEIAEPNTAELINSPFGGRYCGNIPPRTRISLYKVLAIGYYTDKNFTTPELFEGVYSFISDEIYEIGTPVPHATCNFTISATVQKRQGNILTPTYPGVYPKDLVCSYKLLGTKGQRIRLEFRDFDLFYGGPHCPFDYVKIYDGQDTSAPVIGTYCGQQRNLVIYSSENNMLLTFATLQRAANTQNRGFSGMYEFSESFVKLDFICKNDSEHIRGSECDQKILSKKESRGMVYSPNYPFLYFPKIVCRYFIYGMQDMQHLERVKLEFEMFDIPEKNAECNDGYLKMYLRGQDESFAYDKYDHEFCGKTLPQELVSEGPRLMMVFSAGELQGTGFKAKYTFETDYRIPGTPPPNRTMGCTFTYRSTSKKYGEFNSPRFPSNYPSRTNCTYLFYPTPNEQVNLVFDQFKVRSDELNISEGGYYGKLCQQDWLEVYNMYKDGTEKLIGRYCRHTAPGPIESFRGAVGVKVILRTDDEGVYSGFKARYMFEVAKPIFGDCGGNLSSAEFGMISSPNWPNNYDGPPKGIASKTCNWYISVRNKHRVLINFDSFSVEGDPMGRGCSAATVRVWPSAEKTPLELCGSDLPVNLSQFTSEGNTMRISFIIADKAVGEKGFRAVWTEIKDGPGCDEFHCDKNEFCISEKLKCNKVANCGYEDRSDEANCMQDPQINPFMLLGVGLGVAWVLFIGLCIWCHRKRKRRREEAGHGPRHRHVHVCDHSGERFASVDSV